MSAHPLNSRTLLSFCKDLGAELARTGADLPEGHALRIELAGMSALDQERVEFFLEGILFENEEGHAIRTEAEADRRRFETPSAQSFVADWQVREAKRQEREIREAMRKRLFSKLRWVAFWTIIALVAVLDYSGALNHMAGGQ